MDSSNTPSRRWGRAPPIHHHSSMAWMSRTSVASRMMRRATNPSRTALHSWDKLGQLIADHNRRIRNTPNQLSRITLTWRKPHWNNRQRKNNWRAKSKECKEPDSLPVTKIKGKNPNQPTKHPKSRRSGVSHRYPVTAPRKGHRHFNEDVCIKHAGRHPAGGKGDVRASLSLSRSCVEASFFFCVRSEIRIKKGI